MMRQILSTVILVIFTTFSYAQSSGTVRGKVKSAEDGNSIPFAKILILTTSGSAVSDADGLFSIPKVETGKFTIRITSPQFEEYTAEIEITKDNITEVIAELKAGKTLGQVDVDYQKEARQIDPGTSVIKITKEDILRVPVTGGVADIAGYFQTVPGVVSTGDQGGQVYVRGGTPIQNKILLDGMTIYNPFHSIGFFSVFETELIRSADIYTGGFNAEYGGRISSVMDITYRDGNVKRTGGKIGLSPFVSSLILEGPISKANNISYIVSGKTSLLEQTSKTLYPYINDGDGLPFNFYDLYGKISIQGEGANKFSLFGFSFNDQVNYQAVSNLQWNSFGGGGNFIFVPQNSELFVKGRLNFSSYDIVLEEENLPDRSSGIFGTELAFDFTYYLAGKSRIDYGFGFNYFITEFETFNEVNKAIRQDENTIEAGAYVSYRWVSDSRRLILEPNVRFQGYSSAGQATIEPRASAKYNITENFRVKAAGGRYTQNFTSTTSDKDVVNLFYGFLTAPAATKLPDKFTKPDGTEVDIENGLQKAWHAIVGTEYDISKKVTLQIEGYYKWFDQMTNINSNKIYEDNSDNSKIDDVYKKDFIVESGQAYGGDIVIAYNTKKLYLWGVYSIGKVVRWNGFEYYAPVFDRRHNINLIGTYTFGKKMDWEFTARWNLGSGLPFKQTNGVYESPEITNISEDYIDNNANELTFLYETQNDGRLPTYHRFDVNLKKSFTSKKFKYLKWDLVAGVTNAYSRQNIFYVNRVTNEKVYQLPIMPSLALSVKF
ncbi:TonB-dependent receptor [Crocinitomix catalasitica]|uniref:TonB-dependent receptor n=1 Tax=Crocinitomix catalasitica TaxID=184607 RepID=UPI0004870E92|nr:TonB-dependent receptor [Crocinitomix catalasitica]